MNQIKIFAKPLEDLEVLEYHVNKFLENVKLVNINTEIGKNKYQEEMFIVTIVYDKEKNE